jgi:hypothetical protein
MPDRVVGRGPSRLLKLTSKTVSRCRRPTSGGMQPVRLSLMSTIWLRVSAMLPMEEGMQPPSRLFARTTTEAGESPRLEGMGSRNLLELRKMASRGRSKSSLGMGPSKSLKRRSR